MSPKGGIRKRMLESDGDRGESTGAGSSGAASSSGRIGGIRRRVQEDAAVQAADQRDLPLLRSMKRDWARGKLSSPQVQEYAMGAMQQGAFGMGRAAAAGAHGKYPQHLPMCFIALFGMPQGAPEISWFKILVSAGEVSHPFPAPT